MFGSVLDLTIQGRLSPVTVCWLGNNRRRRRRRRRKEKKITYEELIALGIIVLNESI